MPSGIWGMIRNWKKHHSLFTNRILNLIRTALTLVPGRKYTQVVDASFRLTQACLLDDPIQGRTCLKANIDEQEFVLCSLNIKTMDSQVLDISFLEGDTVTFSVSGVNTVSLTGHYIPGQPSLIEETYNMLEDQDPMDQEYLDGFGMHHFGIGPTDAEDRNLRNEEASQLETIENDHLLQGLVNSMINSGDELLMNRGYKALAQIAARAKALKKSKNARPNGKTSSKA
ncbi:unnamed protein product [Umbelopsis vinacea]